jgi:hypothetical protein
VIEMQLRILAAALLVTLLALTACESKATAGSGSDTPATGSPSGADAFTDSAYSPPYAVVGNGFDPANFGADSAEVDNPWFPLEPGTHYIWEGRAFDDEGNPVDRKVEFIATDLTKTIAGVRVAVGWDRDYNDDVMGESELAFYAQDREGNVWHLGEYVEHWVDGELDGARLWFPGNPAGAEAGIQMEADPKQGSTYAQGFAPPPWFWEDHAKVMRQGAQTCVPVDCYDDVVVIKEFEPRFPGVGQLKYYARGVGNIRVGWTGNDEEREVMVLTTFEKLDTDQLAEARASVLEQENRGLAYGSLPPMEART